MFTYCIVLVESTYERKPNSELYSLQQQQQYVGTRKTQYQEEREVQFQHFSLAVYAVCCCVPL